MQIKDNRQIGTKIEASKEGGGEAEQAKENERIQRETNRLTDVKLGREKEKWYRFNLYLIYILIIFKV